MLIRKDSLYKYHKNRSKPALFTNNQITKCWGGSGLNKYKRAGGSERVWRPAESNSTVLCGNKWEQPGRFSFNFLLFQTGNRKFKSAFLSLGHDPLCECNTYHGQVCRCCPSFLPAVLMSTKASMSPVSPPFRLPISLSLWVAVWSATKKDPLNPH